MQEYKDVNRLLNQKRQNEAYTFPRARMNEDTFTFGPGFWKDSVEQKGSNPTKTLIFAKFLRSKMMRNSIRSNMPWKLRCEIS